MGYAIAGLYAVLVGLGVPILTTLLKLNRETGIIGERISVLERCVNAIEKRIGEIERKLNILKV